MNGEKLGFSFDFGGSDRQDLLAEATRTIKGVTSELGPESAAPEAKAASPALRLLEELNAEVAEFGAYPEVLPLREEHFTLHQLPVPPRFADLSLKNDFFWVRLPINLSSQPNRPFNKLECAVEFNPGGGDPHLRPSARLILPDRKFAKLLEVQDSLSLHINEEFEFEAGLPKKEAGGEPGAELPVKGAIGGEVEAKAAGGLGFVAGPFTYRIKKAQIEHSGTGLEKVFWRITGAEFFQEDQPTLVIVLQVPKTLTEVKIAAALQAYHYFNLGAAGITELLRYFGERLKSFFEKGAPKPATTEWNISPSLGRSRARSTT